MENAELEYKLIEEALCRQGQEFEALAENIPRLVMRFDTSLRHLYVNKAVEQLTGLSKAAYLNKTNEELGMPPELVSFWNKELNEIIRTAAAKTIPFKFTGVDGVLKHLEAHVFPEFSDGEQVKSLLSIVRDVSHRQQVERDLIKSEEQYRSLVEQISDVIYEVDHQGVITYISPVVKNVLGYDPADITGKNFIEFVAQDERSRVMERFSKFRGRMEYPAEYRLIHKSGAIRWVQTKATPIMNDDGFSGLRGILIDITEHKQAEAQRVNYHLQMKTVFNSLDALVYVVDIESYEVLFINEYGRRFWGDIVGRRCWESIQEGQSGPCPFCTNDRLLNPDGSSSGVYHWEFQNTRNMRWYDCRDRSVRWFDGRMVRLEIATDITERKRSEHDLITTLHQLQETTDLLIEAEKQAAVGRLVAGVAHEILNPVSIISSRLQFMEEEPLSEQARENLRVSRKQLQRIVNISKDLHLSYNKQTGLLVSGDLLSVIDTALQTVEYRIRKDNIRVEYDPPRAAIPVEMDKDKLVKVIVHLLLNACDALADTREKNLSVTVQSQESSSGSQAVRLVIADNGCGIPAGDLTRIFDPFYTTKDPGKGTGLGLSVCSSIIQEHRGRIRAENNTAGGAALIIELK